MVRLRLRRIGRKKQPVYRIVAANITSPRDGRFIEELGWYNPRDKVNSYKFDEEKVKKWLSNGAQPSETVKGILVRAGIVERDPIDPAKRRKPRALKNPDKRRKDRKKETPAEATAEATAE